MTDQLSRLTAALADRYAIGGELGAGGMATVYLAEDLKHHRQVAVKVLRPELAAILGAERFLKEIEVTANLQHPNILPLYDSGEADTFLYYVMPYIEGETLRDKLNREKQLAVEETVEIAKSVAAALSFAHERGVIHRDIKPENILLQSGQALVADFGIALAVSQAGGTRLTETGLSLGTPHYMSPEQATGDRELDARSDVYSLGATVYEMLVGDPPHIGSSAQAIIAKILSEKPSPITQSRDLVPANVDAAVQKALAKSPADRFTTAAKFAEALTNPAFTLPTVPRAATASPADGRWKRLAASFAGLAAVFAVLAVWAWWWPTPKPVARFSLALPQGEELRPGFGSTFALSPDGSRFVYSGPDEEGTQLWLRERDQLHATPLPGTAEAASPFFSPDGQAVAFFAGSPRRLDVVSLGGGPPVTLADSGVLLQGGGDWGPDDYLYFDRRDGLWRVAANGGEPERVTVVDRARGEARHAWPDVLPNGKGALFTIFSSSYTNLSEYDIAVVEFATGEVQVLMRGVYARYAASGYLVVVRADGALLAAPFDQEKLALTGPATPLGERVRVVGLGAVELAFSETGTLLYGTGGSVTERVVWVERDGTVREIDPGWTADFESLALSPDGTRLAVSIQPPGEPNDVWVKQLDRGPLSRLTFGGSTNSRPTWVPDGQAVTFVSNRGRGDNQDLYLRRADGSGPAEVLLDRERGVAEGVWSPDGQWLIYRTSLNERGGGDVLAIRPAVDTMPVALVATEFAEHSPALSPNGRWLVYVSNRSGRDEVYVVPFPNAEDAMWPVSTGGGSEPVWAHSGRELFYRNGANELVAAEVVATPGFTVGTQRVLFSLVDYQTDDPHTPYAVSSDDQRFMMIRRAGAAQGELILVQNWFEELKAKVGN